MREIKFRGQRVDDKQWVCGYYTYEFERGYCYEAYDDVPSRCSYISNENGEYYKVIPSTIGQYTGLDDKNGVKIFEGDIVREHGNDYTPIYQNGIYMAYNVDKINDPYVSTQFNVIWRNDCEVIGNIHDNPELMGETK